MVVRKWKKSISYRVIFRFPLSVFLCLALCLCASVVPTLSQDWRTAHDGVEYAQINHKLGNDPVKINLLRLDLKKVRLDVHHALDKAIGLETTSSIAKRKGGVAAINAGFFRLDKSLWAGDTNGVLMVDRVLFSESLSDRTALFITDYPIMRFGFGPVRTDLSLEVGGRKLAVNGMNRQRNTDEVIVYTASFGPKTLTGPEGIEAVVVKGKITAVSRTNGNSSIPDGGFVVSANGKYRDELAWLAPGDEVNGFFGAYLLIGGDRYELNHVDDIVAGVPQLIKNGKIHITWEQEKASKSFVETRHPRTAVAKLPDWKFLMVTVDGRQPGVSVGMTLQELAEYLLSLGAVDAMNLDGGGSTTMFLDGKVVNTPSDKEGERKIGDAIVVTLRKPALQKPARK
jgi:hypothetical protein